MEGNINMNPNPMVNNTGMMNSPMNTMPMQPQYTQPQMADVMAARTTYPEIYYKVQPHILMACDQMDALGNMMPNQQMMDNMADTIYNDVKQMHPELAEYAENNTMPNGETREVVARPDFYGRRPFRRRGGLRDIIDILLLSELFGRRRRRWY